MDGELVFARAGFGDRAIGYQDAWDLQRLLHERRCRGDIPDACLLLEHQPVYTAGKRTSPLDRPIGNPGAPVIDVDRGGKITWHGPGQLVGYPILRLADPVDVVAYVRRVEELLIEVVREFGVEGVRVAGRSGVWVVDGGREEKIAAIGIRVAGGVTMHGFALNCSNSLDAYAHIVACGIRDAGVTTISREIGREVTPAMAAEAVRARFDRVVVEAVSA